MGNPKVDRLHFSLVELLCLGTPIFSQTHIDIHYPYDLTSRSLHDTVTPTRGLTRTPGPLKEPDKVSSG